MKSMVHLYLCSSRVRRLLRCPECPQQYDWCAHKSLLTCRCRASASSSCHVLHARRSRSCRLHGPLGRSPLTVLRCLPECCLSLFSGYSAHTHSCEQLPLVRRSAAASTARGVCAKAVWTGAAGPVAVRRPREASARRVLSSQHGWAQRTARPARHAAAAVSSSSDVLLAEVRTLEAERDTAISTAESCAKTATKLAEMARLLEQLALDKVRNGDEEGAKQALQEKASVREALDKNSNKADANYQLAAVLASKIAEKQAALLSAVRSQTSSARSSYYSQQVPSTPSTPYSGSGAAPQWKWQQSLEDAKARLRAQEAEAAREGRMAQLSAEQSIAVHRQRIARQAQASVLEGLDRLRAVDAKAPSSLEAAQARLRARDEETLAYVRRVMARYRRGEYVSEDELEFAFQQLEKRFVM